MKLRQPRKGQVVFHEPRWMQGQLWVLAGIVLALCGGILIAEDLHRTGRFLTPPPLGPGLLVVGLVCLGMMALRCMHWRQVRVNAQTRSVTVHRYAWRRRVDSESARFDAVDVILCDTNLYGFRYGSQDFKAVVLIMERQCVVLAIASHERRLKKYIERLATVGLVVRPTKVQIRARGFEWL